MKQTQAQHETMTRLRTLLSNFPWIRLAVLFGSLAKGTARFDSDIDLAVLADQPLEPEQKLQLMEEIALALDRPVDIIDLARVGLPLLDQIVRTGVRVVGTDERWAQILYRNMIENADFAPLQQYILTSRRHAWIGH